MKTSSFLTKKIIVAISIILPLAVASLFGIHIDGYDFTFLPPIYATINGTTALVLLMAVFQVKKGNVTLHEKLIKLAMSLTTLFLVLYIAYHTTTESTKFGGEGIIKYTYFFILITHILLSIVVIPLVLFSFFYGMKKQTEQHKKIVRFAFPLWLYVAISGVVVYVMIAPYY